MKFMLLIYGNEAAMETTRPEQNREILGAYMAYTDALKQAGAHIAGDRLRPTPDATTVRIANGKMQVLNGPYAETKEQLGGYYLIDVPDLDAALSWAARCPATSYGTVEVRPLWPV